MKTQIIGQWRNVFFWPCLAGLLVLLTPSHAVAETNYCTETGPHYGSWTLIACPSQNNTSSVSPTSLCGEKGKAPTVPSVTPPTYSNGQKQRSISYDCPTTNPTSETGSISYAVSGVLWDPPLPGALTNSFCSTAYVNVTSTDSNLCAGGRVNIGTACWTVSCNLSSTTTNCTPGSIRFTNGTITTNVCLGSPVNASVTQVISNAIRVITSNYTNACGNPDTNCPATKVTNSIPPTIISNWWVAAGPGTFSKTGSGTSASFTPTNGGSGTVTFHVKYTDGCSTNVQSTSLGLGYNIKTNCYISSKSTNCTPGTLVLTNLTVTTNACPNTVFTGSASHVISNAIQIITTHYTNACGATASYCPDTKVTNSIAPGAKTNWWVVTGVGATPPSGSGLSATFTPTNGGNGTLTFYTKWTNGCSTTEYQTSASTNFHVGNCPCTTPLSDAEWAGLTGAFPRLVRCHTCKQGNATPIGGSAYPHTGVAYNCLAWCINDVNRWWWPEADANLNGTITPAEMTAFLAGKGIAAGSITYYGPAGSVVHVARNGGGSGPDCLASSKLGQDVRISHNLNELEGGAVYGNINGGN